MSSTTTRKPMILLNKVNQIHSITNYRAKMELNKKVFKNIFNVHIYVFNVFDI